ncbi:GTPase-activating protein [Tieghemiomyces parasiticus]|uniref:GTPase-activating protein n=1 Tax=Tieghemiomyces parasiticus TaxID=78921 RepID=A0A9W8DXZ8_9FUNG|nr:GTPase-activating protein [Tieghemiomyces parasiticus]
MSSSTSASPVPPPRSAMRRSLKAQPRGSGAQSPIVPASPTRPTNSATAHEATSLRSYIAGRPPPASSQVPPHLATPASPVGSQPPSPPRRNSVTSLRSVRRVGAPAPPSSSSHSSSSAVMVGLQESARPSEDLDSDDEDDAFVVTHVQRKRQGSVPVHPSSLTPATSSPSAHSNSSLVASPAATDSPAALYDPSRPVSQIVAFNQVNVSLLSRPKIISKSDYVKSPRVTAHSASSSRRGSASSNEPEHPLATPQSPMFFRPPKDRRRSALRDSTGTIDLPAGEPTRTTPTPRSVSGSPGLPDPSALPADTTAASTSAATSPLAAQFSGTSPPGTPPPSSPPPSDRPTEQSASPEASHGSRVEDGAGKSAVGVHLFDDHGNFNGDTGGRSSSEFSAPPDLSWEGEHSDVLSSRSGLSSRNPSVSSSSHLGPRPTPPSRPRLLSDAYNHNPVTAAAGTAAKTVGPSKVEDNNRLGIRLQSPIVSPSKKTAAQPSRGTEPEVVASLKDNQTAKIVKHVARGLPLVTVDVATAGDPTSLKSPEDEPLTSSSFMSSFASIDSPPSLRPHGEDKGADAAISRVSRADERRDAKTTDPGAVPGLGFMNNAYDKFSSLFQRPSQDTAHGLAPLHSAHYEAETRALAAQATNGRTRAPSPPSPGSSNSATPSDVSSSTTATTAHVEMLLAQLEAQNQTLQDDPKAARLAKEALRRSWLMIKEKTGYSFNGPRTASPLTTGSTSDSVGDASTGGEIDWDFWGGLINDYEGTVKRQSRQTATNIQNGIPPALRGTLWQLMARSKNAELEQQYTTLLEQNTSAEKQIMLDLPRTLPHEAYFKDPHGPGQESLFHVLKAYALYDPEVGYCQGIAFIVAPLLLNMPEEEAFCLLVRLMQAYDLRGHFTPTMEKLHLRLYQLEKLVEETLPLVHRHFIKEGIHPSMFASQWFMTLFAYRFPVALVFRLLDLVFAEGIDTLLRFALVLLRVNQPQILSMHFEHLMEYLQTNMLDQYLTDPTELLREAAKVSSVNPRKLRTLARDYQAVVTRQRAEENEVERLRRQVAQYERENRHLQGTLQELNQEHCDLANHLVQVKLDYAQEKERAGQLLADVTHLQAQLASERERAEAHLQADLDSLAHKNWELADRQAQLTTQCSELADQLASTKIAYAESENERAILHKKWDDLRKAVKM